MTYTPAEHEVRARFIAGSVDLIRRRDVLTVGEAEAVAEAEWYAWRNAAAQMRADDIRAKHVNSRIAVVTTRGERVEGLLIGFTHECEPEIQSTTHVLRYSTSCVLRFQFGEVTVPRDTLIDIIEDRP